MHDHETSRIRNQHGPDATCATPRCGLPVRWDVMADRWVHTMTRGEFDAANRASAEALMELVLGTARALYAATPLPVYDPARVEKYLRS